MPESNSKKTETNPLLVFASAFSLGAVFTYFTSPIGSKKWQQLAAKWEEVKKSLYQQGLIDDPKLSLEDFRHQYLAKLKTSFLNMKASFESNNLEKELAHLAKLKRRRKQNQKQKFKGV